MHQFYLLGPQRVTEKTHPRDVAARSVEAGNEAFSDGIVAGREYNWHGRSHRLGCRCRSDVADDDSDLSADQLGHQPRQLIIATLGRAKFDRDVLSLDITGLLQALAECGHEGGVALLSEALLRNPITGIADCCARAARGQAATAPPSSVMRSRRFTRSPRRRGRGA